MNLLIDNDQTLKIVGLQDSTTEAYINDATVTAVLKDKATGENVTGQTFPLTLAYVAASDGDYAGDLESALDLEDGSRYIVEVTVAASGGRAAFYRFTLAAGYRQLV